MALPPAEINDGNGTVLQRVPCPFGPHRAAETLTKEEVEHSARSIGINLEKEPELRWIAEQKLATPLPAEWHTYNHPQGYLCFFHAERREVQWDNPLTESFKEIAEEEREKGKGGTMTAAKGKKATAARVR